MSDIPTQYRFTIPPKAVDRVIRWCSDISLSLSQMYLRLALAMNGKEETANKNAVSGYAGLNASSRITKGAITTDDIIVDTHSKGLVLKDSATPAHYWRVAVSTSGVLSTSDLGTTAP